MRILTKETNKEIVCRIHKMISTEYISDDLKVFDLVKTKTGLDEFEIIVEARKVE